MLGELGLLALVELSRGLERVDCYIKFEHDGNVELKLTR
jgi:hypothetical protein